MRTTEFVGRMAALPTRFDIRVMDDTHTSHVAPYTGHPFTDRCDCPCHDEQNLSSHTPDVCVCAGGE